MKSNATLIILVALVVGAAAYWYFSTGTGNQPPLTASTSENTAQTEFKTLINELPVSFNTGIFLDVRFNALVDLTTQISPESLGRLDPFAPIQGISAK
jgi:hypothetical protein